MCGTLHTMLACLGYTALSMLAKDTEIPPSNSLAGDSILKDTVHNTPWAPRLTLQVNNITLYPASPGEGPWSFDLPGGQSCTLSHGSICCQDSCLAIDNSVSLSEPKVNVLGGVNVTIRPQETRPLDDNSIDELLSTFTKEKLLEDADEAAGKMFEFAIRVVEQIGAEGPLSSRIWKRRASEAVVDAAARAVASIGKVTASTPETMSIATWLSSLESARDSRGSQHHNDLIRAALNRMQWFKSFGEHMGADIETARTLATTVLYHLGANNELIDSGVSRSPGSISLGLDAFAAQADLPRDPAFQNHTERLGTIVFARDIPAGTYAAFCAALDGSSGEKISDPDVGSALFPAYSTVLTERQYSQLLRTDLVSSVFLQPTEGEYAELHVERTKKHRRSIRVIHKPAASEAGGNVAPRDEDDGYFAWALQWAGLKRQDSQVRVQSGAPRYLSRLSETSKDADLDFNRNVTQRNFTYDSPAGRGVTIFVVGSGLTLNDSAVSKELRLGGKDPSTFHYHVPAPDAIPRGVSESRLSDRWDQDPEHGWGTAAASLAAGSVHGVARDADVFAVKAYWEYPDPADKYAAYVSTSVLALMMAFEKIRDVVETGKLQGKAVVLMTPPDIYVPPANTPSRISQAWREFLTWARLNQVTVVVPSGDRRAVVEGAALDPGGESNCVWAADGSSFDLGASFDYTDFPEVLHARSAEADATYSWFNGPPVVGGGEYLYAQGADVAALWGDGKVATTSSTVNAAGIIAGLAAYYLAHPDFQDVLGSDNRPLRLKQYMAAASWPRVPKGGHFSMLSGPMEEYYETCEDVVELADKYPYAIPNEFLPMVHNLVSGFQNGCDKPGPRATNSTDDPFSGLSCQNTPPTPTGTFDPALVAEDQMTTGQTWSHLFCTWMDPLADFESVASGDDMTVRKCGAACCGRAYMMLGNGTECYCADGLGRLSDSEEMSGECSVQCAGDKGEECGGEESVDVWAVDQVASEEYCEG